MLQTRSTRSQKLAPSSLPGSPRSPVARKVCPSSQNLFTSWGLHFSSLGLFGVSSRKTTRGFCEALGLTVAVQSDLFAGVLHRHLENGSLWLSHPSHSPLGGHNLLGPWGLFASPSLSPGPISNYHLPPSNCESCSFISEPNSGWAAMTQGHRDQGALGFLLP